MTSDSPDLFAHTIFSGRAQQSFEMVEMLKLAGALLRPLHLSMGLVVAEAVPETDERQQTGPNTLQHSTGGGGCNVYKTDERR